MCSKQVNTCNIENSKLCVLAKLMDETECVITPLLDKFTDLQKSVFDILPKFLDDNDVKNGSAVLRECEYAFERYSIMNALPQLGTCPIVSVFGKSAEIEKMLSQIACDCEIIEKVKTVPVLVLNGKKAGKFSALTYMNKVIELSSDEVELLLKINKKDVDLGKLIKMLIVELPIKFDNVCFLLLPEKYLVSDDVLSIVDGSTKIVTLYDNKNNPYGKTIGKGKYNGVMYTQAYKNINSLMQELDAVNHPGLNYKFSLELKNIFLDVDMIAKQELKSITKCVEYANSDLLENSDPGVKKKIDGRKNIMLERQASIEKMLSDFSNFKSNIITKAIEYEKELNTCKSKEIFNEEANRRYVCTLADVFLKNLDAGYYIDAKKNINEMSKKQCNGYEAFQYSIAVKKGLGVEFSELKKCFDNLKLDSVAKCRLICNTLFKEKIGAYNITQIQCWTDVIKSISEPRTAEEAYCFGMAFEEKKDYKKAISYYKSALFAGLEIAGERLNQIYLDNKNNNEFNLEDLSKFLISEVNYQLYKMYARDNYISYADFQLRLAVAGGHKDALYDYAMQEYKKWKKRGDKQTTKIKNVLDNVLASSNLSENQELQLKVILGEVLFAEGHYRDAYNVFKKLDNDKGFYMCGVMNEEALGRSENLKEAATCYRSIKQVGNFPDALKRLNRVVEKIKKIKEEEEKKKQASYAPKRSYSHYSHDDGFCFITTATCRALCKDDTCEELRLLREFRDNYMLDGADNSSLVDEYYRIAPKIVEEINADGDTNRIYQLLWKKYIRVCCKDIQLEKWEKVKKRYIDMVVFLSEKYDIEISNRFKCDFIR